MTHSNGSDAKDRARYKAKDFLHEIVKLTFIEDGKLCLKDPTKLLNEMERELFYKAAIDEAVRLIEALETPAPGRDWPSEDEMRAEAKVELPVIAKEWHEPYRIGFLDCYRWLSNYRKPVMSDAKEKARELLSQMKSKAMDADGYEHDVEILAKSLHGCTK